MKEMVGGCCVCSDERGWAENPLVYCDGQGCTVAVHQACYGIVTVPTGPWFCRKCESQERAVRVRCELCPIKDGALKRTDNQAWAHVVCALYIPEVRFGNVTTMEPIILQLVPQERYNKTCYICEEQGKGSRALQGACMNCNKPGCKMQFHVTCAQGLGLLCEEAGNYLDNVKYCGYCQHHYSKLKKGGNVKQVPPYKPVTNDSPEEREESGRKRKSQGGKGGGRGRNATPSPNLNKPGGLSPSAGSESGDHSRASTPAGSNGSASKDLLPPPSGASSVIKDSKDKDKKEDKGKEGEKDKDKEKKDGKDIASSSISSTASTTSAKFTTSNFVETVVTPSESVFGADGSKAASGHSSTTNTKKRRNAAGTRTPPSSTPSQDKDTKEKERDALGSTSTSATPSPTSAPSNNNSSVTKMDVDESPSTGSPDAVEKGVKKLKIVAEPNLSTIGSNQTNTESSSKDMKSFFHGLQGPQSSASSPAPVGSSVSSSANSIVVSVPLTAAVSLPNTSNQQVSSALNALGSGTISTAPTAATATAAADSQPQLITSSSNSSSSKSTPAETLGKRSSSAISMKESPPSSPEPVPHRGRPKARRGHHSNNSQNHKDEKDQKIFQNGVTSINNAPHMLGHQLNPSSSMAQKMSDTLTAELEAHSVFSSEPNLSTQSNLVGPQLPTRVLANARAAESKNTPSSGVIPQTLDQLLERQWEQGSQFLMEQAQHFDIASLLTCLHQLRSENTRLEEHLQKLLARRDHLLAVNARLAIPLTHSQPLTPPHTSSGPSSAHAESIVQGQGGLSIGPGQSPGPLTPQGVPQGASQGPQSQSSGPSHVSQGSPQLPSQGAAQVSTSHHGHPQSHSQNHSQSHSQHMQHSQSHPQSLSHPQGHLHQQGHPHSQAHPQGHPQGLPQGHPQALLQNTQNQQSRQTSQRSTFGQQPLENGLPSDSGSMHPGYGAHQRAPPNSNIRHTQSGSPYMMSQTPQTSNPSVVRSSPVSSEQGRRW